MYQCEVFQYGLHQFACHLAQHHHALAICWQSGHWYILEGVAQATCLYLSTTDGLNADSLTALHHIGQRIAGMLNLSRLHLCPSIQRSQTSMTCGATALLHLAHCLGMIRTFTSQDELNLHHLLRRLPDGGHLMVQDVMDLTPRKNCWPHSKSC